MQHEAARCERPIYFLVLGYSTQESAHYAAYLDMVAEHHRRLEPEFLVLCGGVTGKPSPDISEAEWMARQLESRGLPRHDLRLEERSRTTVENFLCAHGQGLLPNSHDAVIFCDSYRRLKVRALVRHLRLETAGLVHRPMEKPLMGLIVRLKGAVDAARLLIFGPRRTAVT